MLCPALGQVPTLTLPAAVHVGSPCGHREGGVLGGKGPRPPSLGPSWPGLGCSTLVPG